MITVRLLLAMLFVASFAQANVIRVDGDVNAASPDGLTWATAFSTIQAGVAAADSLGGGEVWVAEGVYAGSAGNPVNSDGDLVGDTTVILLEGVHLYGGFDGSEGARELRDWKANATTIDGQNVRRGVFSTGIPVNGATFDGFIVKRGLADTGAGMHNDNSAPAIVQCLFEDNHANLLGGGVFSLQSPSPVAPYMLDKPTMTGVEFRDNTATYAGGGIYTDSDWLVLQQCTFVGNSAALGGGVYDNGGRTELFRSVLRENTATDAGGAYAYEGLQVTEFTNTILTGNSATNFGGAIYHDGHRVSLTYCTVADNSAGQGGAFYGEATFPLLLNSIVTANGASNIVDSTLTPFNMLASCVEDAAPDASQQIIDENPQFVAPNLGFYGLLEPSPCRDTGIADWAKQIDSYFLEVIPVWGELTEDINGNERPQGPGFDMGAYEVHAHVGDPDLDSDGMDDAWELEHFGTLDRDGSGDEDGDGLTDLEEFQRGTDPNEKDTDGDGFGDGEEVDADRDPLDPNSAPGSIDFPDANLELAVRSAIGLPTGPIFELNLVGVGFESLDARDMAIADLTGLEYCTDLTVLNLSGNNVSDIASLAYLADLRYLYLSDNQLTGIEPLAGLTLLRTLYVDQNQIADVSALSTLPLLTVLSASFNEITDISSLTGLTYLWFVDLDYNVIADLPSFDSLMNLELLTLRRNLISDIAPMATLFSLEVLDLAENPLADHTPIAAMPLLWSLELSNTGLSDASVLAGLTELVTLLIDDNEISDVGALGNLTNLRKLSIAKNDVTDIAPLARLTNTTLFFAYDNQIGDLGPLQGWADLEVLYIVANEIYDMSPLEGLLNLKSVVIDENPIADLSALTNNPGIGSGDTVSIRRAPLTQDALCIDVPELDSRGVQVYYTGACDDDSDGDDLADAYESYIGTNPTLADTDGDGLDDGDEIALGTNPLDSDTDGDGLPDGTEVDVGTDPLDPSSFTPDVYVDGLSGSDTEGTGTIAFPWATVAHAVAAVEGSAANVLSIHVAEGTYTVLNAGGGPLVLDSYEHLLGGYEAAGWTRDVNGHPTVLDASVASGGAPAENVVVLDGILEARLDGFTVTGAEASGPAYIGAGIRGVSLDASSTIADCLVTGNAGGWEGGGGMLLEDASPLIVGCTIAGNSTEIVGGGIGVTGNSAPLIDACTISGNRAYFGGGIYAVDESELVITNSVISGNICHTGGGGGLALAGISAVVANCTIAHNVADTHSGGGIDHGYGAALLVNNIFSGNRHFAITTYYAMPLLDNCLFFDNPEGDYYHFNDADPIMHTGAAALNASVPGATGNVDGDPVFAFGGPATWTADASYDPATDRTTLIDSAATFTPGALRGSMISLWPSHTEQAVIFGNTGTSVEVAGDYSSWLDAGETYQLLDYRVGTGSAAIDTGRDTSVPADGGVLTDFDGVARGLDGDGLGAVTGDGSDYDIGAFEAAVPEESITVLSPNGGETLVRDTQFTITWERTGTSDSNVKILARIGTSTGVVASSTANDGAFVWNVPSGIPTGNNFLIEIKSIDDPSVLDQSDGFFTVSATAEPVDAITVIAPNGGETYYAVDTVPVTWASSGTTGSHVEIVLHHGGGSAVLAASTANDGAFNWSVPAAQEPGADYTIEVRSLATPAVGDSSDAPFTIDDTPPAAGITVTSPNGGESLLRGSVFPITWTSTLAPESRVVIAVRKGSYRSVIAGSTPNDGSQDWNVPPNYPLGSGYTIEISALDDPAILDVSDADFSLTDTPPPAGTITVIAPDGGESYSGGDTVPIAWSSSGAVGSDVEILLHQGGGTATIAASTANDGAFDWVVPAAQAPGADYTVEVRSLSNPAAADSSDGQFTIGDAPPLDTITLLAPNGGEVLIRGSNALISWSSSASPDSRVVIAVRKGNYRSVLAGSTPNDGSHDWSVPPNYPLGSGYTIEISLLDNPAVSDTSDGEFSLD